MRALIEQVFAPGFGEVAGGIGLSAMDDGAALPIGPDRWLVVTTDAHVVQPAVFPGGDIGRLAVCGTVNDLAMMGATEPLALTCAAILEDGFPRSELEQISEIAVSARTGEGIAEWVAWLEARRARMSERPLRGPFSGGSQLPPADDPRNTVVVPAQRHRAARPGGRIQQHGQQPLVARPAAARRRHDREAAAYRRNGSLCPCHIRKATHPHDSLREIGRTAPCADARGGAPLGKLRGAVPVGRIGLPQTKRRRRAGPAHKNLHARRVDDIPEKNCEGFITARTGAEAASVIGAHRRTVSAATVLLIRARRAVIRYGSGWGSARISQDARSASSYSASASMKVASAPSIDASSHCSVARRW
ncbi:MAG TPA: AIR synthase related protein [Kofleriaceae bacterium]|jgi:hypothetical protein|nr:AIR synthase related protein [Kofleriaceae bacterium]